jgi:hypothetical protein
MNNKKVRHINTYMSPTSNHYNFLVNPWVPVLWSFIFPGFGHMLTGLYIEGYILMIWEIITNTLAHLNVAMMYSFQGEFKLAKEIINMNWALMYIAVYIFSAWDCYRSMVDTNNLYVLAEKEKGNIKAMKLSGISMVYLEKAKPVMASLWSMGMPGLGHVIIHRLPTGFFILVWWIFLSWKSKLYMSLFCMLNGSFNSAIQFLKPEWFLYMPSLYAFAIYDSYYYAVESNKIFKLEQVQYFTNEYQNKMFRLPSKHRKMY